MAQPENETQERALRNRFSPGRRMAFAPPKNKFREQDPAPTRTSPRTLASVLSKTSHRDVFDGQPVRPPGTGPSGFSAPNGCRRLSPKDPPPLVQGAALGAGRKASFFLFLSQKERSKEKCSLRKGVPPSAEGGRGALPPRLPCKPLKRLDRNFTGLRPCWLKLQALTIALRRVKAP